MDGPDGLRRSATIYPPSPIHHVPSMERSMEMGSADPAPGHDKRSRAVEWRLSAAREDRVGMNIWIQLGESK